MNSTPEIVRDSEQQQQPPAVACSVLLARAQLFHELAQSHRETSAKCDNAELPPEYGDYERGKADAYDICSDTLKHIANRANT